MTRKVPYLVVGRWGVSPLPRQTGLKFVIGEPLAPPPLAPGEQVLMALVAVLAHRMCCGAKQPFAVAFCALASGTTDIVVCRPCNTN